MTVAIAISLALAEVALLAWSIQGAVMKLQEEWPGFAPEDSNSTAGSECEAIEQVKMGVDLATRMGKLKRSVVT